MKRQSLITDYLGALWDRFFLGVLIVIDVVGLLGVLRIVVDDGYELVAMFVLGAVWFGSGFLIFKKQQERITQLEARLATEEKSINAALAMLKGEIKQNLEEFTAFWERVKQGSEPSRESPLVLACRFTDLGPPTLSYTVWEKQSSLLSEALSDEQRGQVQVFYNQLKKISGIHSKLRNLHNEQQENLRAGRWQDGGTPQMGVEGPPSRFQENAPALWDDLEQMALRLIEEGNPLEDKTY